MTAPDFDPFYASIGRFVLAFASAELSVSVMILKLLDLPPKTSSVMLHGLSPKVKTAKLKFVIKTMRRDFLPLADPLDVFADINGFRDKLFHWNYITGWDEAKAHITDAFRNPDQFMQPHITIEPKAIDAISEWLTHFGLNLAVSFQQDGKPQAWLAERMRGMAGRAPPIPANLDTTLHTPFSKPE